MTRTAKRYQLFARWSQAQANCDARGNTPWSEKWQNAIDGLMDSAPHGGGFDSGTRFVDFDNGKLRFETHFHHMNQYGYYDGWTDHTITVSPDLACGFDLTISGRNKNDIKGYILDVFSDWLDDTLDADTGTPKAA